jgi:hypothetical protein
MEQRTCARLSPKIVAGSISLKDSPQEIIYVHFYVPVIQDQYPKLLWSTGHNIRKRLFYMNPFGRGRQARRPRQTEIRRQCPGKLSTVSAWKSVRDFTAHEI